MVLLLIARADCWHYFVHVPSRCVTWKLQQMHISALAADRLKELCARLDSAAGGLRFEGYIGTCRGSSPVFKPAASRRANEEEVTVSGIRFFVPVRERGVFDSASLDLDTSFMGRGLFLTWPHREGCKCDCH